MEFEMNEKEINEKKCACIGFLKREKVYVEYRGVWKEAIPAQYDFGQGIFKVYFKDDENPYWFNRYKIKKPNKKLIEGSYYLVSAIKYSSSSPYIAFCVEDGYMENLEGLHIGCASNLTIGEEIPKELLKGFI